MGCASNDQYGNIPKWFRKLIHGLLNKGEVFKGPNGQVVVKELEEAYQRALLEFGGDRQAIKRAYGNKQRGFDRGAGMALALGLVALEGMYTTAVAASNLGSGFRSEAGTAAYEVEETLLKAMEGDSPMAELSAISAALVMTGGAAAEAAVAWVVFSGVAEAIQ